MNKRKEEAENPGGQESRRTARILRERALELALRGADEERKPGGRYALSFAAGEENYALPVSTVREVCPLRGLTSIPGTPDFVRGAIVFRGQLVSVLDPRVLLGLSVTSIGPESRAIVMQSETMTFSILCDRVGEIKFLADDELKPGEPSLERLDRRYIVGVTSERVVLLDGEKLLSDPALVVNA